MPSIALLLLPLLLLASPAKADAGDVHKWAVIVGTLIGSLIMLSILCVLAYYVFIKRWLDDYLRESRSVTYGTGTPMQQMAMALPQKVDVWNLGKNNEVGGYGGGGVKRYSDPVPSYDDHHNYDYNQRPTPAGSQQLFSSVPVLNNHYPPSTGALSGGSGSQRGAALPTAGSSDFYQQPPRLHQQQQQDVVALPHNVDIRRTTTTTQRNNPLPAAYTGSSV